MRRLPVIGLAAGLIFSTLLSADIDMSKYVNNPYSIGNDVSEYSNINNQHAYNFNELITANNSKVSRSYLKEYYKSLGVSSVDVDKFFRYIDNKGIPQAEDKSTTIFFLTSASVPKSNLQNFLVGYERLKKKNPGLQGYIILNGFIKNKGGVVDYMKSLGVISSSAILKVHPFLFKNLKVEQVPAFVISECPITDFKEKFCDHKIIANGAMPLEQFLNVVEEKSDETKYKKLYYDLINPN